MTTSPDTPIAGRREWIALAVLALPCMLVVMDLTVLFLAVPKLSADLNPSATELLWITDIYGFLIAGALVTMGTLGDRVGRRKLLLVGAAGFGAASLLAVLANSPGTLIAARALQGLAGATLVPSIMSLTFQLFPDPKQRTLAMGVVMSCFAAGAAIGPLVGGAILESFSWNAVFLPNLPVMALLLVLGPRLLPEFRNPAAGRIDLTSAALSVVGILAVIYGVKEIAHDGVTAVRVGSVLSGLAIGALFVRRERTLADPVLDVALFRDRAFSTSLTVNVLAAAVMYGVSFFAAQYFQLVAGLSPLEAGLWNLPGIAALMATSMIVPKLVERIRPGYVVAGGMALCAIGFSMLLGLSSTGGIGVLVVATVIFSVGIAPVTTLGMNLIISAAPPERQGAASGVAETGNELGGALGIALLGSLGAAIYRADMDTAPAAARDTLGGALKAADQLPAAVLDAAQSAFTSGLHGVAITCAVLMAAAAIAAARLLRGVPKMAASEVTPPIDPEPAAVAVPA